LRAVEMVDSWGSVFVAMVRELGVIAGRAPEKGKIAPPRRRDH
jgi:hypothetical protein